MVIQEDFVSYVKTIIFYSRNHQNRYDKEFGVLEMVKSELIKMKIQNFAYKGPDRAK